MISYEDIIAKIGLSNNGKMMLVNFSREEKAIICEMRNKNIVAPASFMQLGDSVKVSESYKKKYGLK